MLQFKIPGMTCGGCAASVRKALGTVVGVESAEIDLSTRTVALTGSADREAVTDALTRAGFDPSFEA